MPEALSPYALEFGRRPATPEDRVDDRSGDRTSLRRHRRTRAGGIIAFDQPLPAVRRVRIVVKG
jgi:hypothetical protein